jgi:hypothetical protein
MKDALLKIYFPQCSSYEMIYDWRNRLKSIEKSGTLLEETQAK